VNHGHYGQKERIFFITALLSHINTRLMLSAPFYFILFYFWVAISENWKNKIKLQ
jgi:hypothetical protein